MTTSHTHRLCLLVALLAVAILGGCSPVDRFGTQVRYSPAYRSYVFSTPSGSDDPAEDDDVIVLRNPLTQHKIRCREDLAPWVRVHQTGIENNIHDEAWDIASPLIMLPATAVAALGFDIAAIGLVYASLPFELARSANGAELFEDAVAEVEKANWSEVKRLLELAVVKDETIATLDRAYYYLGIAYAETGDEDRAREALHAFVERSLVRDVKQYRNAERWLRWLDDPMEPCRSQRAVPIKW